MRVLNFTLNKLFRFQSLLTIPQLRSLTTHSTLPPPVPEILSFWFSPSSTPQWFRPTPSFDSSISTSFLPLITSARSNPSPLDSWTDTPNSTLALLLLLDQFPRNIYRGSALSHAGDAKASRVAVAAIAKGFDMQVELGRQIFFYMPLMHDESLVAQVASVALFEGWVKRCDGGEEREQAVQSLEYAKRHMNAIARFGRFPSRNQLLGREGTAEEVKFLEENPGGF